MRNSSQSIQEWLSNLAGSWASYAALGTFLLYLFGYLSLRFHLTALGIPTDLTVVDQRYFYAGAKFLVYILGYIPIVVLLALVLVSVLAVVLFVLSRFFAKSQGSLRERVKRWMSKAPVVALVGIVVAEVWIQFLMRQCFTMYDVLLDPSVTNRSWVGSIMKGGDSLLEVLFFSTMVAGTVVVGWLLFTAVRLRKKHATDAMLHDREEDNTLATALIILLAVLFSIQVLLLPVNHGVLIADKVLPRVTDLGGRETLGEKQVAWLVWEGNEGVTYLVQKEERWDPATSKWVRVRTLVTLPRKEVKRMEVIANDSIYKLLDEMTPILPH